MKNLIKKIMGPTKNLAAIIALLGLLLCCTNTSWGQAQTIGSFPYMDGGLEGQTVTSSGQFLPDFNNAQVNNTWTKDGGTFNVATTTYNFTESKIVSDGTARSGAKYAKAIIPNTGFSKGLISPTTSGTFPTNASFYVVQYYIRKSNVTVISSAIGAKDNVNATGITANNNDWQKVTVAVTSGAVNTTTNTTYVSTARAKSSSATTPATFEMDDIVVYAGTAADGSPPVAATDGGVSGLNVSWIASSDVDGGGYMVVRYATNPNADNDPNANGIYAVGNTISNGTGSLVGTVVYLGTGTSFTDNVAGSVSGSDYYKVYTVDKAFNYATEITATAAVVTTPLIASPTTTLTGFNYTGAGPSASQSFVVSGSNLTNNLVVSTASTDFELSANNFATAGASSISLSGTTVASTTISVRLKANLLGGAKTASVTIASTGANTLPTLSLSGSVQSVYYYNGSGLVSSNTSWGSNSDGTGTNPSAVTATYTNFVIANGNATTNAAWTLGSNSKVIVGNGASTTLTVANTFPITGTIDATATGIVVWQHVLSAPTFGTLANASEVHLQPATAATYALGNGTAYGKLFIDGAGQVNVNADNSTPTVKTSLTVASGSILDLPVTNTHSITINAGASATINGTVRAGRQGGLLGSSPAAITSGSSGISILFADATPNLTLGASSTIDYYRTNAAQTVSALPSGVNYANLTLSENGATAATSKVIPTTGITVNGTLTISLAGVASPTSTVNADKITLGNGATIVKTAGNLNAPPTFAGTVNVTYNGTGATQIIGGTTASSPNVTLTSSNAAIAAGMTVKGNGVPTGTTVGTISGTALVLSQSATTSATVSLEFGTAVSQTLGYEIPTDTTKLNNLTINNAAGVTLGSTTTINGTLTLTKGKLVLPASGTLQITSGNAIVGGSSTNYIVADPSAVVRMDAIASERVMPIGNTTKYLPITITPASAESLNIKVFEGITANAVAGVATLTAAQKTSLVDAVWNISLAAGSAASNRIIKVEWPASLEDTVINASAAADLGLISNNGSGGWNSPTGSVDKTNRSASATVTSFGSFSAGRKPMLFAQPATKTYGDTDFFAGVTSLNTSAITYAITYVSNNLSVATIANDSIHIVGAGTATITASQITDGVYAAVSISRTLTVDKAALTITADDQQKFLLAVNPTLTATYTGFKFGETEAVLLTPLVLTTTAVTSSVKGSYPITGSGATAANYSISFVDGSLRVLNAAFEFDTMPVKNFGDADFDGGAFSINTITPIEYVSDNTAVATIVSGKIHIVAVGTANITASQQGSGVYPSYTITQTLTVNKKPMTISFAALPSKVYGDADFSPTATSSNSNLSIVYSSSNAAVASVVAGKIHIVGAGSSIITASQAGNANYASATGVDQVLIIDKAALSITADNKSKYVGQANPALTYIYSGFVLGETATVLLTPIEISTTAVTASAVGTYPITVSGATADNYTISLVDATLTVKEKEIQTITFEAPATKTYGNADFAAGGSSTNASIAVVYSSSNKAVATIVGSNIHIVGTGTTDITATQAGSDVYEAATSVVRTFTVSKAALKITADNKSKIIGQANPVLTVTYTGFVLSENSAVLQTPVVISTTAVTASLPGTYTITASAAAAANYTISYVSGTLTVNPKQNQTISFAAPAAKNYGNADFAAGATSTNATLPISYSSSNQGVATIIGNMIHIVGAGTTVITASQNGDAFYYPALEVSRTLTVSKVPLTIKATDTTKIQGEDNPVFAFSYTGLVAGETGANLMAMGSTSAVKGSTAGYYSITPTGADTSNYIITYVSGRFTIYPPSGKNQINLNAYRSGSSQLTLQIYSTQFVVADAILYNLNGTPIKSVGCNVPKGFSTTKMDLPFLLPGLYIIKVKGWAIDCKKIISIL